MTQKDSKKRKKVPKYFKCLKEIPMDSKDEFERLWKRKPCKTFKMDKCYAAGCTKLLR